jgi:hypothetical protein
MQGNNELVAMVEEEEEEEEEEEREKQPNRVQRCAVGNLRAARGPN